MKRKKVNKNVDVIVGKKSAYVVLKDFYKYSLLGQDGELYIHLKFSTIKGIARHVSKRSKK